jgi:opacity protein-like surface antigen
MLQWSVAPVAAQSGINAAEAWSYELTPYLWGSAMKGDVRGSALPKTSVDMSFGDIVDVLDFGLMGAFEGRKQRWGFYLDGIYMKVSDSATARRTGPGPIGATLTADANVKLRQTMLAGAVMYRAVDGRSPVDVFGGLRYNKIDVEANIDASLFALSGSVDRRADKDWFDPYIGVRVQHPVSNRWSLVGYADVGGFGVGSDFAYQAAIGLNYAVSKSAAAKFGYRHMNVDYAKGDFAYDMKLDGLYIGVGLRF